MSLAGRVGRMAPTAEHNRPFRQSLLDLTTLPPGWTLTSSSAGRAYFDASGDMQDAGVDTPRHDHAPTAPYASRGICTEAASTRLNQQPVDLSNAYWTLTAMRAFGSGSVADAVVAPKTSQSMDFVCENNANTTHSVDRNLTGTTSTVRAVSIYVRANGRSKGQLRLSNSGNTSHTAVDFDLVAKTATASVAGTGTTRRVGIEELKNGVFRIWVAGQAATSGSNYEFHLYFKDADGNLSYAGDNASGMYLWGAQVEVGECATSLMDGTPTSTFTRAAEILKFNNVVINAAAGSAVVEFMSRGGLPTAARVILDIHDGSFNNRVFYTHNTGAAFGQFGAVSATASTGSISPTIQGMADLTVQRTAMRWARDDFAVSGDGGAPEYDNAGAPPVTLNTINLGSTSNGSSGMYGWVRALELNAYPMSDAELRVRSGPFEEAQPTGTLVWAEEFDGPLDLTTASHTGRWRPNDYYMDISKGYLNFGGGTCFMLNPNQHPQYDPFPIANSVLSMTARRTPPDIVADIEASPSWASGSSVPIGAGNAPAWCGAILITDPDTATFGYGYYEVKARAPGIGKGAFLAPLWFYNANPSAPSDKNGAEIDLVELFGYAAGTPMAITEHMRDYLGAGDQTDVRTLRTNMADWHRYGVDYQAGRHTYYFDGKVIATVTGTAATWFDGAVLGLRSNFAVGGNLLTSLGNAPDASTPSPMAMEIDYIRQYTGFSA